MRIALYTAAVFAVFALPANAELRPLRDFSNVAASAGTQVQVAAGSDYSVDVSGRDAERIVTRVEGGTLYVEPVRSWSWRGARQALVRVTLPAIAGLDASSGAHIAATGVSGGAVALEASSGARVEVSGACASVSADASSGGDIRANALQCQDGSAQASSGASVRLSVSNRLDVDASSGGDIYAYGNPSIGAVDLSSGGSFRRVN